MGPSALRGLNDRERIAALDRDLPALEAMWFEDFAVNAPNDNVVVERQRNLDTPVRSGIIDSPSFERTFEIIRIDRDFGVIVAREAVVPRADALRRAGSRSSYRAAAPEPHNEVAPWR